MDEPKTCPMAFFTPIVEIAEAPLESQTKEKTPLTIKEEEEVKIKNENDDPDQTIEPPKTIIPVDAEIKPEEIKEEEAEVNDTKDDATEIKEEPKEETKEPDRRTSKRKRGRPKKIQIIEQPQKPKRKYTRKSKKINPPEAEPKEKKRRKQSTPRKKTLETDVADIKYDDDVLITPEHLELNRVIKCPICKDEKEWNLKEIKEHYKQTHPGKRLRTSRFFGDMHPCDICGKEFKSAGSLKDHVETHNNYYYCDICNHSTKKILDHIVHLRVHNLLGIFQCLMCEFNTLEINQITDHVIHHEDLLKYWCDSCKKSFNILQHFQEHDNYHTGLKPFDCEFCGKCFLYSRYLHAHKINMHREEVNCPNTYECVICNKVYQHRNSLKLHMNSHTGNFAICDICGKTLSSKEKLKFHLRTHTGYKPYSCQYCGKCFTKKPILVEHVRVHTGEKPYICDFCTKGFSQRSSLVIHMRGHTGEKPYVCQFCGKGFVAKAMLNIHLKTCKGLFHVAKMEFYENNSYLNLEQDGEEIWIQIMDDSHLDQLADTEENDRDDIKIETCQLSENNEEDPVPKPTPPKSFKGKQTCNACGIPFKLLNRHLESHGPYNCTDCLLHFPTKDLYMKHIHDCHSKDKEAFTCDVCELGFSSLTKLALHMFKHTQTYCCPLCNFKVKGKHKHSLVNHIKRHEGQYSVFCDVCGQGFIEKHILASHMEIHEAIPKYECEFCKKKFTVKRYLDVHKSFNHKKELYGIEETFQCEVCGRSFTFEKSLIRHLSAIHKVGEDRTVECPVCNKKIANNHNLKVHMRVHTGEKRFCCDTCGKAFSEKKYLQKHQAGHERAKARKRKGRQEVRQRVDLEEASNVSDDAFPRYKRSEPQLYLLKTENGLQVIFDTVPPKFKKAISNDPNNRVLSTRKLKKCPECGKFYRFLGQHVRLKHDRGRKSNATLCPICGKFVRSFSQHQHKKEVFCHMCFTSFKSPDLLIEHQQIHTGDHYKCDSCPKIFKTLIELAVHHYAHTNTFMCPKCSATFKTKQTLRYHMAKEEESYKYNCHICGKGFVQQHVLQWHLERHENNKKYECKICHKKFNLKMYLKSHERLNHKKELFGVEEVFQCEYCSRTFSFECSLKRHLNLVHKVGEERAVKCNVCSKVLTTTYSLTVHMRLHTGEKNFDCSICGEKFSRTQYVTRHMARQHGVSKTKAKKRL